ncbi:hypothetical protein I317_01464, partial [Kwoniella heveanensis CBS 569]
AIEGVQPRIAMSPGADLISTDNTFLSRPTGSDSQICKAFGLTCCGFFPGVVYAARVVYKPPIHPNAAGEYDLEDLRNLTPTPQHEITPFTQDQSPVPPPKTRYPEVQDASTPGYEVPSTLTPPSPASPGPTVSSPSSPTTSPPVDLPPGDTPPATIPFPKPQVRRGPPPSIAVSPQAETPAVPSAKGSSTTEPSVAQKGRRRIDSPPDQGAEDRSISTTPTQMYSPPVPKAASQSSSQPKNTQLADSTTSAPVPHQVSGPIRKYTYSSEFDRILHDQFDNVHPYEPRKDERPIQGSEKHAGSSSQIKRTAALKPVAKPQVTKPQEAKQDPPPQYEGPKPKGPRENKTRSKTGELHLVTPLEQDPSSDDLAPPNPPFARSSNKRSETPEPERSSPKPTHRPVTPPSPAQMPLPSTPSPSRPPLAELPSTPPPPPFAGPDPLTPPSPPWTEPMPATPGSPQRGFRPLPPVPRSKTGGPPGSSALDASTVPLALQETLDQGVSENHTSDNNTSKRPISNGVLSDGPTSNAAQPPPRYPAVSHQRVQYQMEPRLGARRRTKTRRVLPHLPQSYPLPLGVPSREAQKWLICRTIILNPD